MADSNKTSEKQTKRLQTENIARLMRNDRLIGSSITFYLPDGTKKVTEVRREFVKKSKGNNYRAISHILEDINAIAWDNQAESFSIM